MLYQKSMWLTKTVFILCCLFCLEIGTSYASAGHTVKGVVITPDGKVVPEFSVVVRHASSKPEIVIRRHFKDGEFLIDRLDPDKYLFEISCPLLIGAKLTLDLTAPTSSTNYNIVILHSYRNEAQLAPGAYSVSVNALQQKIPAAAREAYQRGVEFHRNGDLNAALIEYGKALRAYPQYVEALTDLGAILLLYNQPDGALIFLRRAQAVDDTNSAISFNVAVALTEQGDYPSALKLLRDILHREPRLALAQFLIAKIHYLQKTYDQADAYVRLALENDPALLDAWLLKIKINIEQGDYSEARQALQRVREAIRSEAVTEFIDEQLSALGS
jgi:tetratricopeptide (TPR) repeat protein